VDDVLAGLLPAASAPRLQLLIIRPVLVYQYAPCSTVPGDQLLIQILSSRSQLHLELFLPSESEVLAQASDLECAAAHAALVAFFRGFKSLVALLPNQVKFEAEKSSPTAVWTSKHGWA
jgi:hypothetical protein